MIYYVLFCLISNLLLLKFFPKIKIDFELKKPLKYNKIKLDDEIYQIIYDNNETYIDFHYDDKDYFNYLIKKYVFKKDINILSIIFVFFIFFPIKIYHYKFILIDSVFILLTDDEYLNLVESDLKNLYENHKLKQNNENSYDDSLLKKENELNKTFNDFI